MYSLPFVPGSRLIELGGGATPRIRPNLDKTAGPTVDIVADLNEKLPLGDNSYDGVYASYIFEHVSWRKVRHLASEVYRILDKNGTAVIIIPNTLAQAEFIVERGEWSDEMAQFLFGDQNYQGENWDGNAHHAGFSPTFVFEILRQAGFAKIVIIRHPDRKSRDIIVEAFKERATMPDHVDTGAADWTPEQRKNAYDQAYFNGGGKVGGYAGQGFSDFPVHNLTAKKILELKPTSVLELGAARGYILKRIEDTGIKSAGLEISEHCYQTRVIKDIRTWDVTQTPWPVADKEFDLCYSVAFLEHIPEQYIDAVSKELDRVSRRGVHGIDLGQHDDGFDKTHCNFKPLSWWQERLPVTHRSVDKEDLEHGDIEIPAGDGKLKLNIGSYTVMSHHGWINMDLLDVSEFAKKHQFRFMRHDATKGLPYDDGKVDLIYTSHFLEHLEYTQGEAFLGECRRVLKPGGTIRVIVPDAKLLARVYTGSDLGYFDQLSPGSAASPYSTRKLWELLLANHKAIYDSELLCSMLRSAGFSLVNTVKFREGECRQILSETLDMFPTISLYVEARA